MSRIGLNPIKIEEGVEVTITGKEIAAKGPKGELKTTLPVELDAKIEDGQILVSRIDDEIPSKSLHGTFRSIVANTVEGVSKGFEKKLELVGVGYRAKMEGTKLSVNIGLNHPVTFETPEGLNIEVPEETKITITGIDKQKVGQLAAKIRASRKPEPYKGKGIRYEGEYVRRKSAKAAVGAKE